MGEPTCWQAKLAARLHDPIEKSLILMRSREGHEGGTSKILREQLGLGDLPWETKQAVNKADHWASAADRAAFPKRDTDGKYPKWQNVQFYQRPVIIHPLTGDAFDLGKLTDIEPEHAKSLALDHLRKLIHGDDTRKTALAFWRFGPEIDAPELKNLWSQLPADTRVPDHNIFDHLDLTAALASSFALDERGPALLSISIGPVQEFIAAARSSSDLWAGSHLLARLSWEAMKVICEKLGPEAILFPRLRGIPQVDLWLRDEENLDAGLFNRCDWTRMQSDANPLFAAALPNRFTALVPVGMTESIVGQITNRLRQWVVDTGERAFRKILEAAKIDDDSTCPAYKQIHEQLAGFPEVHWSSVPFSLVDTDSEGKVDQYQAKLAAAMQPFYPSQSPGFLGKHAWKLMGGGLRLEQGWFWRPNPGSLYPALHELSERVLASAKSLRPFSQVHEEGWRDSLAGEAEWLTTDREQLSLSPGQRTDTIWTRVAEKNRYGVKSGEHLSALGTIKRLWPNLYVEELKSLKLDINRFVVSTHTMALAASLAKNIKRREPFPDDLSEALQGTPTDVALPRKLNESLRNSPEGSKYAALPGWLERQRESEKEETRRNADSMLEKLLGGRPETYYSLLLMDGDRMGAWLSADPEITLPYKSSFHPQILAGLQSFKEDTDFKKYANELRSPSPSRHMAISEALNNFALTLAPDVVERQFHGRVLYSGGDDLMAMLPVIDLLPAAINLRAAYSGSLPTEMGSLANSSEFQQQGNGFVLHKGKLLRVMGSKATTSGGAVIAHHQAPLGSVLRELRAAENRAKSSGRNCFSLAVVKRSGGDLFLTLKWGEAIEWLIKLRQFMAEPEVSRRAAYNSNVWLKDLPPIRENGDMVATMLAWQLDRQAGRKTNKDYYDLPGLARGIIRQAIDHNKGATQRLEWIMNFLSVAEFLARETRGLVEEQIDGPEVNIS